MAKILILDGQQRNVLSCVRALAKLGHVVDVGANNKNALCFSSRFASGKWVYPDPATSPDEFLEALLEKTKSTRYDLALPFIDASTKIVVDAQDTLRQYVPLHVPRPESFHLAFDKARTFLLARELNLPAPATRYPENLADAINLAKEIAYPLVIKPRRSSGSRGFKIVNNEQDLVSAFPPIHAKYPEPILQEYIPLQEAVGFVALYDNAGQLKAFCQHKRLHEFPLSGGPSTLRTTIHDKRLYQYGTTLLEKLQWRGPAMVEFRVDSRDGVPKLMEINPRLWGSIALHIAAGINFPDLIYREANGLSYSPVISYHVGTKAKWLLPGELLYFMAKLGKGKVELDALKWWGDDLVLDIIAKDDPLPALTMLKNMAASIFDINYLKHAIFRS